MSRPINASLVALDAWAGFFPRIADTELLRCEMLTYVLMVQACDLHGGGLWEF